MKREVYGDWVLHCSTHVELLRTRALRHPDKRAYTFLANGETEVAHLTFAELDTRARAIAALLQENAAFGQRVLLLYQPGLEYLAAFFGCLYSGAIAVPAYPPKLNHKLERLEAIASDAQPAIVLSSETLATEAMRKQLATFSHLGNLRIETTDTLAADLANQWREPELNGDTLAFLQYTSGSTGKPKGVMVSHRNLLCEHQMFQEIEQHPDDAPYVSWLPLFHDMGLIGNALQAVYRGVPCIFMSPSAFLQKPFRWLQAISQYRAYSSFAPNFAYDLCVQKITPEQRTALDLGCWHFALNGAEPVFSRTLERFAETFAACGFRRDAFRPAYGLAEATLCVSCGEVGTWAPQREIPEQNVATSITNDERNARTVVGCGHTWLGQKIVIVDPELRTECSAGQEGEVWVSGPIVAQGYWNDLAKTQEIFHAHLANTGEGPFLRTGDLGFMQEGELYITGRLKDLMIIHGQNYYPQDIELAAVESHPGLVANGGAVFSLSLQEEERVILVQEIARTYMHQDPQDIFEAIRRKVSEEYDLHIYAIVLIRPGGLTKTSSGKIQRRACREALLDRALPIVFADMPGPLSELVEAAASGTVKAATGIVPPRQDQTDNVVVSKEPLIASRSEQMQFSLLYFSSNEAEFTENKYELLLEGAKFADQHEFTAIWMPERHFHPFGGLYPNPSVLAASLATITQHVRLRAGSVVLPMHHPVRVVEEWSTVDNLSSGRVDMAFATGWNPNDFVLAPANYKNRKDILFSSIDMVKKLWRGDSISLPNGLGQETTIKVYPLPKQPQFVPWITCSGTPERFAEAGAIGANVLTGLLFQSLEELAEKIKAYREALAQHGYDPARGHVTLMLHTYIGESIEEVREKVRQPFIAYLESSVDLWRHGVEKLDNLSPQEREQVLSYAFERYFHTHALMGTPQTCEKMVERLSEIGVNEIASLIDFGMETNAVMDGLYWLNSLRKRCQRGTPGRPTPIAQQRVAQPEAHAMRNTAPVSSGDVSRPAKPRENEAVQHTLSKPDQFSLQDLLAATQKERQSWFQKYLQQQFAQILGRSSEDIANTHHIRGLGLDSLMVMSIVNTCQSDFQITLDAGLFYRHDSFVSLARYIADEFDTIHGDVGERMSDGEMFPTVRRQERQAFFPLSYAQQRLWFLHQLRPDTPAYNVSTAISIEGNLDKRAFERSLERVMQRHESLRTTFSTNDGLPVQVISATAQFSLLVADLGLLDPQSRITEMHRLARQQAQLLFDLTQGPLIRMLFLSLNSTDHTLLFTYHHIVADGWSRGVFIRELQALYMALVTGRSSPLEELSLQYADFAIWQHQWLQRSLVNRGDLPEGQDGSERSSEGGQTVLEGQLAYWKKQLGEDLPVLEFPASQPRPPLQTFHGSHQPICLPERLMEALGELSRQEGVSLFMVLLASFQVLLARYTNQEDIPVGTNVAGRNRRELEPLIGFFVNTLVIRTNLAGNPSFREVLRRVRDVCLEAYAHQEVPFEKVVEALQPKRDLSRHPLFQVMFVWEQDSWRFEADLAEAKLRQVVTESGLSTFDLTWLIAGSGRGEVEYNTDLFAASAIIQFIEHWQVLLEGIASDVTLPIAQLPLLTPDERLRMLVDWNATRADYPRERCFHELFEIQVERSSEAIAVMCGPRHLTYGEVNKRANQFARYLRSSGVGPGSLVGICLHRSCELITVLLAVFKAGGAYVPLDPAYPSEHLAFIFADSRLPILITDSELEISLPHGTVQTIRMPVTASVLEQCSSTNLNESVDSALPAYLIYTSGSTGRPKGVLVPHRGLVNLAVFQKHCFQQHQGSRVLQFASLSFDASIWEIAMTLLAGATLHMAAKDELLPGPAFVQLLDEQGITTVTLPPSAYAVLPSAQLPGLQTTIAAGEDCFARLVALWAPGRRFFNAYGPTEASVCATVEQCTDPVQKPAIGRPIANAQVYVLDACMQPVPADISGELYIGGAGLAYGYLNRLDLTAERFVPNPFAEQKGERLYKTGDVARYRVDGAIEYVGRVDYQAKIRGYRIEPGEVEAALLQHPAVRECAVVARDISFEDKQLVAYVVLYAGRPFSSENARMHLQQYLPEHMVPAVFVPLEQMPLMPSGKVNRRLLLDTEVVHQQREETLALPSNETELAIAATWQECLHVEKVGRYDNFFDLGGHSLLAVKVLEKLQERLQRELALALVDLFEYPTVSTLAEYLDQGEPQEYVDYEQVRIEEERERVHVKASRGRQKERRMRQISE